MDPVLSSKKKTTSKKLDNTIKESKKEDKEDNDDEDDDYADDDFTMEDAYGEEDEDEDDDDGAAGFKSPAQGQTISNEDSKKYPYMNLVLELLTQLKQKYPQYDLNGWRNTWILKPGGKSRGRGIKCFRSYEKMMMHIRKIKARQWVVQKYIENPMLIMRKKFDIR